MKKKDLKPIEKAKDRRLRLKLQNLIKEYYREGLDCDGQSRVFTYFISNLNIGFYTYVGAVQDRDKTFPLHYWLEVVLPSGTYVLDCKLRKWLYPDSPHGLFKKEEYRNLKYEPKGLDTMRIPLSLVEILLNLHK